MRRTPSFTGSPWVQGFLGHSKLSTTERYLRAKARPEDAELLNRAFGSSVQSDAGADR